jgi:hypothetical protein
MWGIVMDMRENSPSPKLQKHRPLARNRDPKGQQEGYRETPHHRVGSNTQNVRLQEAPGGRDTDAGASPGAKQTEKIDTRPVRVRR